MAASLRDGYGAFRQPKFECGCCEMLAFRGFHLRRQNLYVFSLRRNPDLDHRIFDCLLISISAMQTQDIGASFLFVSDLNGHHKEWLVLPPRTVMELQLSTSQLFRVAIRWLSVQPTHVVEHLTF